jgi:hypothetical protein
VLVLVLVLLVLRLVLLRLVLVGEDSLDTDILPSECMRLYSQFHPCMRHTLGRV